MPLGALKKYKMTQEGQRKGLGGTDCGISFRKTQLPKLHDKVKWASPAAFINLRLLSSPDMFRQGSLMLGHGARPPPYTGAMLPPSVWSQSSAVLARHAPSRDTAFHLQGLWPALILVGVFTVLHMLLKGALVLHTLGSHKHPAVTEG